MLTTPSARTIQLETKKILADEITAISKATSLERVAEALRGNRTRHGLERMKNKCSNNTLRNQLSRIFTNERLTN